MKSPGWDDPTEEAKRLRECMAEMSRMNGELSSKEAESYRHMAHEAARFALKKERKANGVDNNDTN